MSFNFGSLESRSNSRLTHYRQSKLRHYDDHQRYRHPYARNYSRSWAVHGAQVRSDGVLEAQLYLRHVMPYHFRKYTLVAENSVAMTTSQVQLLQASPSRTVTNSK